MRLQSTFPELESIAQRMGAKPSIVDQMINEVDVMGYGSSSADLGIETGQPIIIDYNGKDCENGASDPWTMIIHYSKEEYKVLGISENHARTLLDRTTCTRERV